MRALSVGCLGCNVIASLASRWKALRGMGALGGSLYVAARLLASLSRGRISLLVYHLVAQPVRTTPSLPTGRGSRIEVREAGQEEVLALPVERPRAVLEARFRQGARCLLATSQGRFLGFLWLQFGPYDEDEVRCRFVPGPEGVASWDFDVFVEPSARIGLAFARLWDEANRLLSSQGVKWSISRISAFNAGSLSSHGRLGLVRLGTAGFVLCGPLQLTMATTRPYLHLALNRAVRPEITLRAP